MHWRRCCEQCFRNAMCMYLGNHGDQVSLYMFLGWLGIELRTSCMLAGLEWMQASCSLCKLSQLFSFQLLSMFELVRERGWVPTPTNPHPWVIHFTSSGTCTQDLVHSVNTLQLSCTCTHFRLDLAIYPQLASNTWSASLSLPSTWISDVYTMSDT